MRGSLQADNHGLCAKNGEGGELLGEEREGASRTQLLLFPTMLRIILELR